jgi:hypothetical protein
MKYSFFIIYLLILFLKNDMNAQSSLELAFIKVLNENIKLANYSVSIHVNCCNFHVFFYAK